MKPITNIAAVQEAGDSTRLQTGGYICAYTSVEDVPEKNYLFMEFDIAEGEFKDYFKDLANRAGFWGGRCYRSYTEKALPMFKRMCSAVTKSNPNFIFDGNQYADEKTLVGKKVGMILGEEEYLGNDGNVKTRIYVAKEVEISKILEGDFKVPALKKLENAPSTVKPGSESFMAVPDTESPFN